MMGIQLFLILVLSVIALTSIYAPVLLLVILPALVVTILEYERL